MVEYYCDCCGVRVELDEVYYIDISPFVYNSSKAAFRRILCKGCVRRNILKLFADGDDWI